MRFQAPRFHHAPLKVAADTYLIRQLTGEGEAPVSIYVNSLVILGKEPIIVDTGTRSNRTQWLKDVFSLVDPKDVKWVFLSHDDPDHTGNLAPVMEMCPNATLVTNWFSVERMHTDQDLPLHRMRWVNDGESFDAGDRTFAAVRPPLYDSPTTRGLFDSKTGVYWASDCFGTPVLSPVDSVAEMDIEFYRAGAVQVAGLVSPWSGITDQSKFSATVNRVAALPITQIVNAHGPAIRGEFIEEAFRLAHSMPTAEPVPLPGQAELEAMVAAMLLPEDKVIADAA